MWNDADEVTLPPPCILSTARMRGFAAAGRGEIPLRARASQCRGTPRRTDSLHDVDVVRCSAPGSGEGDDKLAGFRDVDDHQGLRAQMRIRPFPNQPLRPRSHQLQPERIEDTFWHGGGILPNAKYEVNEMLDGTEPDRGQPGVADCRPPPSEGKFGSKYRDYTLGYLVLPGRRSWVSATWAFVKMNSPLSEHLPYNPCTCSKSRRLEGVYVFNERDAIRVRGFLRRPCRRTASGVGGLGILTPTRGPRPAKDTVI